MHLHGFHHLTAVTAHASANLAFYTQTLGLRLVKKTVNQDDTSAYHLFYADARGSPGTDITFFDWPLTRERRGTHFIARTGFRLSSEASLHYWSDRLSQFNLPHAEPATRDNRLTLDFEDPEGQRLRLTVDPDHLTATPWDQSPVPPEHQLQGLGPITLSVPDLAPTDLVLTQVMNLRPARQYEGPQTDGAPGTSTFHVYESTPDDQPLGPAAELHVAVEPALRPGRTGAGGVHHVAFRVPTFDQYDQWHDRLRSLGVRNSGPVDRFYFKSLYFREPNGILFELATDAPGFAADEPPDQLGQRLALPPFLEPQRQQIEANLKPLKP